MTLFRQRLFEVDTFVLQIAFEKAGFLELAQKNAEMYNSNASQSNPSAPHIAKTEAEKNASASNELNPSWFFFRRI